MGVQRKAFVTILIVHFVLGTAFAVQPDELLADPVLEARAREISKEVRCLVCRNESIDDSHASLARDLRILVRERLAAGDSDDEVRQFLVERFGEYVLLKPAFSTGNALLWLFGPLAFLLGLGVIVRYLQKQQPRGASGPRPLTEDERKELASLVD